MNRVRSFKAPGFVPPKKLLMTPTRKVTTFCAMVKIALKIVTTSIASPILSATLVLTIPGLAVRVIVPKKPNVTRIAPQVNVTLVGQLQR